MTSHNPIRIDQIDGIKINNYTTSHDLENNTQFKWLNTIAAKINYLQIAKIAHELITKYNGKAPVKSIDIISLIQLNEMPGAWPNNNSWGVFYTIDTLGWDLLKEEDFQKLYKEYKKWKESKKSGVVPTWEERKKAVTTALDNEEFYLTSWFVYDIPKFDQAVKKLNSDIYRKVKDYDDKT